MSAFTDAVVNVCAQEYATFGHGKTKEYDSQVFQRVGDYWNELAKIDDWKAWKGYNGRTDVQFAADGTVALNKNQPWSAAFISFVAKQAGAGDAFRYGPSHSVYIVRALRAASTPGSSDKFIARRHTQYAPKVGDLIACERRDNDDANFDTYIDFVKAERYEAHCDFVVGISKEMQRVITIGGNVGQSVKSKEWPIDANGRIGNHDPGSSSSKVICIIETLL